MIQRLVEVKKSKHQTTSMINISCLNKSFYCPAVVAWFVKASVFHSVNSTPTANGGSNPAWVWYINGSEVETLCCNSNCRAPGQQYLYDTYRVLFNKRLFNITLCLSHYLTVIQLNLPCTLLVIV